MALKHPEYASGISDAELIKEALEFCDHELDSFDSMDFDSDSEVCCQRSNTFIRELVERLQRTANPSPVPNVDAAVRDGISAALVAMKLAAALPGVAKEYDFSDAIAATEAAWLKVKGAPPAPTEHLVGGQHPDDIAVDRFAAAMKAKLAKKRDEGRGGWEDKDDCSQIFLSQLLREHVEKGDPVDVGNLAMMLHQRDERISSLLETF